MKNIITLILLLVSQAGLSQIPEKEKLGKSYGVGCHVFEAIENNNKQLVDYYFKDTTNLMFVLQGMESNRFHEDNIHIRKDVMYNQETGNFEFLVYGGKYTSTEDWGLFDYYFVLQVEIDMRKEDWRDQIVSTSIIKDEDTELLKAWWRGYMKSYKETKYARKEIADKYGLVPPPPPPPETEEWF